MVIFQVDLNYILSFTTNMSHMLNIAMVFFFAVICSFFCRYFHVNFGFNLKLWDWMHDTLRKETRIYSEEIYGGRGMEKTEN